MSMLLCLNALTGRSFIRGYGYEDFVRGLQVSADHKTEYKEGVLLSIVRQMNDETDDNRHLPVVLILDEMNRADLSKVLGECFSLLEDRDTDITLGGYDGQLRMIRLPSNLYLIGTMNLIDQSLEHVDFALRRRFLWFFRGFSREDFLAVSRKRWEDLVEGKVISRSWGKVEAEFDNLAGRAARLNEMIDGNSYLGSQYEIGHTYFCDVVGFSHLYLTSSEKKRRSVLFNGKGAALEPVDTLWRYSLEPLLTQYLSGIDSGERERIIKQARGVLLDADK
jgi:5-methylcytosine-specific restriction protein B